MGGGDLNSKKSWHPNTMKNQERVWKAEQAAAEEKNKMLELQRERAQEQDRADLLNLMKHSSGSSANDNRLAWMYDKPDKKVEQEEYLLGRAVDKNPEQDKIEQDVIPAVSRRVVGSSMMTAAGDAQVDMSRKIREDPLLLIKERERAARAALLNNPLHRRRLAELLRKEQESRKETKSKKKVKKKGKNLDDLLAAKLNALGGQKGIDLASLLDSDDSSSDSSSNHKRKSKKSKKKKKKHCKEKKKERQVVSDSEDEHLNSKRKGNLESTKCRSRSSERKSNKDGKNMSRKRRSSGTRRDLESEFISKKYRPKSPKRHSKGRDYETESQKSKYRAKEDDSNRINDQNLYSRDRERKYKEAEHKGNKKRDRLTEAEKAARLAEMAAAGAEREVERGRRVAEQRAEEASAARIPPAPRSAAHCDARAIPDSLESRIHSSRHFIQRDKKHMNEHFARR